MKKILITTSTYPTKEENSASLGVVNLAQWLSRRYMVFVLAPDMNFHATEMDHGEVTIIRYRYFFKKFQTLCGHGGIVANVKRNKFLWALVPFLLASQLIAIIRIVRKEQINIIQANWAFPQGFIAYIANIFLKTPYIITVRGSDIQGIKNVLYRFFVSQSLSQARAITATNPALARDVHDMYKIPMEKIKTIPTEIDFSKFFYRADVAEKIGKKYSLKNGFIFYAGRITDEKGIEILVRAMEVVHKDNPNITLLAAGVPSRNEGSTNTEQAL